jgi:hypothetical protein
MRHVRRRGWNWKPRNQWRHRRMKARGGIRQMLDTAIGTISIMGMIIFALIRGGRR